MKIIICIKQVPDTTDIKWTENNTIQREGVESVINPFDVYALEAGLKIKKAYENVELTVLTMGPPQAEEMLKKAIAIGCDNAVLVSDRKFAGADTYATGKTLAATIKNKLNNYDLIICGQFAVDGDTAQTGPSIANHLGIPQVTYVKEVIECTQEKITLRREIEEGTEIIGAKLPALICILKNFEEPTRPLINGVIKSQNTEITTYSLADIGLSAEEVGLKGSPTYVSKAFRPIQKHNCQMIDCAELLCEKIMECKSTDD